MTNAPADKLPRVLSHSAHEVRTPLSVALGFIGFVLRDKKAQVTEQQREWLELANKACRRLAELADEMSELSNLESGEATLNRTPTDLRALLVQAIAALRVADREIDVELSTGDGPAIVHADAARLKKAFTSILFALGLETSGTKLFVQERSGEYAGKPVSWIVIGDFDKVQTLPGIAPELLDPFNEKRGKIGLSLWIASWVLNAHGGAIWSPPGSVKTAAVVMVPLA